MYTLCKIEFPDTVAWRLANLNRKLFSYTSDLILQISKMVRTKATETEILILMLRSIYFLRSEVVRVLLKLTSPVQVGN